MSGPRPSHLLCLAVWAVALRAGEPPPPAPAAPDGISAAKREFDTLKGPRNVPESQKIDLPISAPPTLNLGNDEMAQLLNAQAEQKKQGANKKNKGQRGTNWLVDAMTQKSDTKSTGSTDRGGKHEAESGLDPSDDGLATTSLLDAAETPARETSRPEPRRPEQHDNPLTSYMSGWMTPKDYELLRVKPAADGLPSTGGSAGDPVLSVENLARASSTGPAYQAPAAPAPDLASNPYLNAPGENPAGLAAAARDFANVPPPVAPTAAPPAPAMAPAPEMTPPPPRNDPPINDVLKPNNDTKYFRQLKRF